MEWPDRTAGETPCVATEIHSLEPAAETMQRMSDVHFVILSPLSLSPYLLKSNLHTSANDFGSRFDPANTTTEPSAEEVPNGTQTLKRKEEKTIV